MPFLLIFFAASLHAQEISPNSAPTGTPFRGESSCSSSGCHGGAGEKHNQCLRWSKFDVHTRSYATLTLRRSELIADVLKLGAPTQAGRCTVCHAPFQNVATNAELRKILDPAAGVSCETCHGAAESWLISHTRDDFTHQDRVNAGLRDENNLYVRANTCVACHQNVDADILAAGHPELIFELDGQSVAEPKHWKEAKDWSGPQTWLVGQVVALREMSWQLANETSSSTNGVLWQMANGTPSVKNNLYRWNALVWLIREAVPHETYIATLDEIEQTNHNVFRTEQEHADKIARRISAEPWPAEATRKCLNTLAGEAPVFRQTLATQDDTRRLAERLVLALDRLVSGLSDDTLTKRVDATLAKLFKDAQSLPDFNPATFADDLEAFQKNLTASP